MVALKVFENKKLRQKNLSLYFNTTFWNAQGGKLIFAF